MIPVSISQSVSENVTFLLGSRRRQSPDGATPALAARSNALAIITAFYRPPT